MQDQGTPQATRGARAHTFSLTNILIFANVAVFLWMAWKGVSPRHPNVERIRELGANFGPYTLGDQPWRLLTANYIHFGWGHLLTNMISLWGLGRLVEAFYSRKDYFLLYSFAGICGSLLSVYMRPLAVGAGASGAVFGLAGALLATLRWGRLPITDQARRGAYKQVLEFAGLNLLLGFGLSLFVNIDNYGHMGGLIGGGIVGLALGRQLGPSAGAHRARRIAWLAIFLFAGMLMLAVARTRGFVVDLYAAQQDLARRKYDPTLVAIERVLQKRPDLADAHMIAGEAWMAKRSFARGAEAFGRAADLMPHNPRPLLLMATAYQLAGELPKAEVAARRLVEINQNDADAHFLLGAIFYEEKKLSDAEASLLQSIRLAKQPNPHYWAALGNVHLVTHQPTAAIGDYEQALAIAPEHPLALRGMVAAHTALGHRAEAAKYANTLNQLMQKKQAEVEQRRPPPKR
jgi:rhomboid protease GluP